MNGNGQLLYLYAVVDRRSWRRVPLLLLLKIRVYILYTVVDKRAPA
jgi:hypothetical protein